MHARQDPGPALRSLAAAQAGLLTSGQAAAVGFGLRSVRRLVDQGHWLRVAAGVYDTQPGGAAVDKRLWSAFLRAGDPAAIGGEAALRLYGLDRRDDSVVVWVPADRRPRPDPSLSIRRDLIGRLARRRGLPARIRAEDAVVDVAEGLRIEEAVALVCEAARRRLVTPQSLRATIQERSRVRGRARLLELVSDLDGVESTLEYAYRRDVERAHGLPSSRRQRSFSAGTRSDVAYEEYGLLVELDGKRGHIDADSAFRDLRRDNAHAIRNLVTLRYGTLDVRGRPCETAHQVAAALAVRGWTGALRTCPSCARG